MTSKVQTIDIDTPNAWTAAQVLSKENWWIDNWSWWLSEVSHDATLAGDGTVGYPLSVVGWGSGWSITRDIKTSGVIYQAWSWGWFITINFWYDWIIYSDATPTPTTVIWHWNHPNYWYGSMTVAIKPNEYYQVTWWVQDYYYSEAWWVGPAWPSGTWGNIVFVSDDLGTYSASKAFSITHNLNVTQADVEAGRYKITLTQKANNAWLVITPTWVSSSFGISYQAGTRDASAATAFAGFKWQADTLSAYLLCWWGNTVDSARLIIEDLRLQTGGMGSGAGQTIFISTAQSRGSWYNTITHNLAVTQSDVEAGRYAIMFSFKQAANKSFYQNIVDDDLWADQMAKINRNVWSSSNPSVQSEITRQANTLIHMVDINVTELRCHIIDTRVTNSKAGVEDTAYGPSWDWVTNVAPSKNAVYDKIESMGWSIPTFATHTALWQSFTGTSPNGFSYGTLYTNTTWLWLYQVTVTHNGGSSYQPYWFILVDWVEIWNSWHMDSWFSQWAFMVPAGSTYQIGCYGMGWYNVIATINWKQA